MRWEWGCQAMIKLISFSDNQTHLGEIGACAGVSAGLVGRLLSYQLFAAWFRPKFN